GQLLDGWLASIGLYRDRVRLTNAVFGDPPETETPTRSEIDSCLPFLFKHIALVRTDGRASWCPGSVGQCQPCRCFSPPLSCAPQSDDTKSTSTFRASGSGLLQPSLFAPSLDVIANGDSVADR